MSNSVLRCESVDLDAQLTQLQAILPHVWSRESSGFPDQWTRENPSCGQCHPTTRLVEALFGGLIIYQTLDFYTFPVGQQRYWTHCINEIDGVRYDLSSGQMEGSVFRVHREFVLTDQCKAQLNELPQIPRMINTLFEAYNQYTGEKLVAW